MSERMSREKALSIVLEHVPQDAVLIAANGHNGRALFRLGDRPGAFYMIGSMGLAPSIALGIALVRPERTVVVFDGDGNVLMNLGALASVAAKRPERFLHLCFDNESHASTGGQSTISDRVALDRVAAGAGYAYTAHVREEGDLRSALEQAGETKGPSFLLIKVRPGGLPPDTPRVAISPEEMTARLRRLLEGEAR